MSNNFDKSIFINQSGYYPQGIKRAVITIAAASFDITDISGNIRYTGKTTYFGIDKDSQDDVYIADFSDFNEHGTFILKAGNNVSLPIYIGNNVYDKLFSDISRAFYYLRCGCGIDEKHGGKFTHGNCHHSSAVLWDNHSVSLDLSGGWHDAGDYGRYVTAGACALAHILLAWKMFPDIFKKLELNIPESGNGLPDILNECRYELEWLLKMQNDEGGVYHKATTAQHAPFVMPEDDTSQMYALPVSSMAVADFTAICAMASDIYKDFDSDFSDRLFTAAIKSYTWLDNNPDFLGFENPEGCGTGCYGERDDKDNRFWAAVEMYNVTGNEEYHKDMEKYLSYNIPLTQLGYWCVSGLGAASYLLSDKGRPDLSDKFRKAFSDHAENLRKTVDSCGYSAAMRTEDYCWGSNMNLLKNAMILILADRFENTEQNKRYIYAQLDYLMGVNATGYSYVTGNGSCCVNYPHLRPAHADGIEECIPGMISGGANRFPCEHDRKFVNFDGVPAMKCFADLADCYSLNEITIYWNSPAVFLLAYIFDDNKK